MSAVLAIRMRSSDLAVQVFIRRGDVATAEPDADGVAFDQHGWVADDFRRSRARRRRKSPAASSRLRHRRVGQAQAAIFFAVAAGVEHPILAVRLPDGGLAQAVFVERAVGAEFENGIGAKLFPADAIRASGRRRAAGGGRDPGPGSTCRNMSPTRRTSGSATPRSSQLPRGPGSRTGCGLLGPAAGRRPIGPGRCAAFRAGRLRTSRGIRRRHGSRSRWRRCSFPPRCPDVARELCLAFASAMPSAEVARPVCQVLPSKPE